jgi:uncharacterized iron-regulated membrane protein
MGGEEQKTEGGDGVRLFVGLVAVAIDFVSTVTGLWECRRKGCSKKDKALLRRRRNAYIRWVREVTRRVVSHE